MYGFLPVLFALALSPESEKKLETLNSLIMATKESVISIRSGLDSFHATMLPLMMTMAAKSGQTTPPSGAGN